MRKFKIIFILIVSFIILSPAIFFNFKKDYISEIDNRKLLDFPSLKTLNGETFKSIAKYLDDRAGFRQEAIQSYTVLNDKIFSQLVHPSYTYGKDGYVFFQMRNEEKYTEYHKTFLESLVRMRNYVESKGSKFYIMINPEKSSVYTEYLPEGVNYNRNWIEEFEENLKKNNISYIDNTEELKLRSKKEFVYDKMYDAGHWNDLGAFYGVNNLLDKVNKDFPSVQKLKLEDFDISKKIQTTLKVSKFSIYDESPVFELKHKENYEDLTSKYMNDLIVDKNYPTISYTKNNSSNSKLLPKALVFQGSYLNGREKYLMSRFSDYIAIHNYQNVFNLDYYYEKFNPNIVIFEVAEYTFNELYFSEEKMKNMNIK